MNGFINNSLSWGLLTQGFVLNALISATIVAVLAASVGFFALIRDASFAAHALPKMGFAGAAGAVLLNINPVLGLIVFAVGGALGIGGLGRHGKHEVGTALLLVAALGTGALFLVLNNNYAAGAYALLFGQIVGVSGAETEVIILLGIGALVLLSVLFRPLFYVSVLPDVAGSRGMPVQWLGMAYLTLVGLTTAITVPVVGALLSFSLMIAPAATAGVLWHRPSAVVGGAIVEAVMIVWLSLLLALASGLPVGFFVATMAAILYGAAKGFEAVRRRRRNA